MAQVWQLAAATESPQHDTELPQTLFFTFRMSEHIHDQNLLRKLSSSLTPEPPEEICCTICYFEKLKTEENLFDG